jgi:putative phosphoesterase
VEEEEVEEPKRLAVLSDLHANARATRSALKAARDVGYDRLIFLGDLLTYGCNVQETLEIVYSEVSGGALLVEGNHDRMYRQLLSGQTTYYESLPSWIQESADFTLDQIDEKSFLSLPWQEELAIGNGLLAHANPFGFGNWTYIDTPDQKESAREVLIDRGFDFGIFGHTHRAYLERPSTVPWLANPGSIGQPRGVFKSSLLILNLEMAKPVSKLLTVRYDVGSHVADISNSSMSSTTREKLCSYFDNYKMVIS